MDGGTRAGGVRASVLGTATLLLALAAHLAAGGALPTAATLAVVALPVGCASVVLARRVRRTGSLFAALAAGQLGLHELFMAGAMPMPCLPAPAAAGTVARAGHESLGGACAADPALVSPSGGSPGASMLLAHAVATYVTAVLLTHAEQVVRLARAWLSSLPWRPLRPLVVRALPALVVLHAPERLRAAVPASDLASRGPPVLDAPLLLA